MVTQTTSLCRSIRAVGLAVVAVTGAGGTASCLRSTEELSATVNTRIFIVGLPTEAVVEVEVAGQRRRFSPTGSLADPRAAGTELLADDVVEFQLSLPAGTHAGTATTFAREGRELLRALCGTFEIDLPDATAIDTAVLSADDLTTCERDDDDSDHDDGDDLSGGHDEDRSDHDDGDGNTFEGEGEGEGSTDGGASSEGEGEGEGEGPDA